MFGRNEKGMALTDSVLPELGRPDWPTGCFCAEARPGYPQCSSMGLDVIQNPSRLTNCTYETGDEVEALLIMDDRREPELEDA